MIEWATQYWYLCVLALLIGIATAAWIWLRWRDDPSTPVREIDDEPAAPLEPVRPVIDIAERIDFSAPPPPAPMPVAPVSVAVPEMAAAQGRPAIAPAIGDPDDLSKIKGVGPKLVVLLSALGVTRFDQIAAWDEADIAEVDRFLGSFQGRITRDAWVEQADYLARGDTEGFARRFGALG